MIKMFWEIVGIVLFAMQVAILLIALVGFVMAVLGISEEGLQRVLYRILR